MRGSGFHRRTGDFLADADAGPCQDGQAHFGDSLLEVGVSAAADQFIGNRLGNVHCPDQQERDQH